MKTIRQSLLLFILFIGVAALVIPVLPADNDLQLSVVSAFGGGGGEGGGGGGEGGGDGCGGCGGSDGGDGPGGGDPQPPTCNIRTSISSVNEGDAFRITWAGTPSNASFKVNGTNVIANDYATYTWPAGRTNPIVFTMVGNNGGGSCVDSVTITRKAPTPKPICSLDLSVSSLPSNGGPVTISWTSNNVGTDSTLWVGDTRYESVGVNSGSKSVTIAENTLIRFDIWNPSGSDTCTKTVTVEPPVVTVPRCDAFSINQSVVAPGANLTFNWSTTNVSNASINGIGSVSVDGSNRTFKAPSTPGTYTYTLTFDGKTSSSCRDTVVVKAPEVPTPTCDSFNITQSTVAPEANLTFNWSTTNVSNVSFNNGIGNQSVDGTNRTFTAPVAEGTYTYVLTFDGQTNASCVDTVKVEKPVVDAPVCVAFTATPTEIVKGESITLNWEVLNAVTLGLNNGIGDVTGTTTFGPVSPMSNTLYVLDVIGVDGTKVQCEAPVKVTDPVDPTSPAISIIKRDAIDKDDTQTVEMGGTAAFEIIVTNSGDEDLVNVVVTDVLEPACDKTIGSLAVGASDTYTCNSTNVLSAFINVAGTTGDSAVDGETVTDTDPTIVEVANTTTLTCSDISISASGTSVREGSDVTLEWVSTGNVGSVSIDNGIGSVALTGNRSVRVNDTTTYNFTINGFSDSESCPITISATTGGGGGGSSSPRCELEISDSKINRGDEITLTWDSTRARELILTDDRGNVIVTTEDRLSDDKEELFEGEITLTPTRDTEYTLRVERGSRDRECTVDVEMDDEIVLLQTRDQAPLVTGISLTQVPYTGFEAGSVMTFMFYALLVAWALYITYVLVIPKSMLRSVPVLVTPRTTSDLMTSAESIRPDVFAALPTNSVVASSAPTAPAPANLPVAQTAPVAAVAETVEVDTETVATELENEAHLHQALLSSGAVHSLIAMTTDADRSQTLTKVIADAKGTYPLEDGWVVINQARLTELTTVPVVPATTEVTGNGSLAEAIVTGNVVASYELIGDRPMFALADAAADLDTLYRNRKGADERVSDLLISATQAMTDQQIAEMIAALTGALDGTYTDEASAVKMAIMKAVKVAV